MNRGLAGEVVRMALDTLRGNKLRSGLTILGVVIGITAIVGMTSLIRGFDQSLRDSVKALGPSTIILTKLSIVSISSGAEFSDLLRRPNLTVEDAKAIEKLAPTIETVDILLGTGLAQTSERMYYRGERTKQLTIVGATEQFAEARFAKVTLGRFFTQPEVLHRRRVVVLGDTAYQGLFAKGGLDPIGKKVRIGAIEYTVVGVLEKAPSVGGFGNDQDDMVVIPQTTHQIMFSTNATRRRVPGQNSATIMIVPYAWATREDALTDVEEIMRIRHGLKLDEPNDFDLATQDAILRVWDQISRATFLALIVISSIALMVGGIGVMAIMMISVTERTREIGVRKALGARRQEVLFQFLSEAAVLTSIGGILGILCGSGIGLGVTLATGFPISLPWWSFAIGLGFSAGVGIFFGMVPAVRASRLDPIEALRHE
ncbi:MAG TPA: ABC transporter permease [Vicinamibacterales bacterium]|nr:ABC transporter permease [Vicinamibacterales bacterium]